MPKPTSPEVIADASAPTPRTKPSARLWIANPRTNCPKACLRTRSSSEWRVWARVSASVKNKRVKPPTKPAIAGEPASSNPSGKRSANARASSSPAAKAVFTDATSHTQHRCSRATLPRPAVSLPARPAPSVDLQAVGPYFEVCTFRGQKFRVERALVELGDVAAGFADHVVMVVPGELIARPVPQVQAAHDPELAQQFQRTVHRYQPDLWAPHPNLLEALMLLLSERTQHRHTLRCRFVPPPPHPPDRRFQHSFCPR